MKNGHCPKCNSIEIYLGKESRLQAGDGLLHLSAISHNTGINLLMDSYVCTSCGYVEMYVADSNKAKLPRLVDDTKNWQRVN